MCTGRDASEEVTCEISAERIAGRIRELAEQISTDYAGKRLLVVGVLKGAWVFMADLVRQLTIPIRCDFVRVTSYGMGTESGGEPELLLDITESVAHTHVLVVDDIVDTGISVSWLMDHLREKNPASLRLCVLLDKPSRRQVEIDLDYYGFQIPDRFVIGYGLDWAEQYRELPFVGYVSTDDQSNDT
jgi:hypoxanthine phosphoribosyltransferase